MEKREQILVPLDVAQTVLGLLDAALDEVEWDLSPEENEALNEFDRIVSWA